MISASTGLMSLLTAPLVKEHGINYLLIATIDIEKINLTENVLI